MGRGEHLNKGNVLDRFESSGHSVFSLTLQNLVQAAFLIVGFCFPELLVPCSVSGLSRHLHEWFQMRSDPERVGLCQANSSPLS